MQVEELLSRFGQVAPDMPVFGGVSSPGAWGESESSWGAVWVDGQVMARGAVGCVMQGPFQVRACVFVCVCLCVCVCVCVYVCV